MKKEKNKESIIDLKKKLKEVEFTNSWSPESELKNGSIIDLKKKLKEVEFTNSWSPVDELENGDIESDDKTPTSVKLTTKKDVFITIYEFSERTPKILDNINEYLILNEENINYARMNNDNKGFYEHLKINGCSYLKDNTDLLENLTQSQLIKVQNLILAVYLILKSDLKPHTVQKIADVTRWSTDLIRKHFNIYDLKKNFKKLTLREIETLSKNFPNSNLLFNISKKILEDALAKPKKLTIDALPLGFKTNLKYLAASLIFYALNHTEYNRLHTKFKLYTVTEYINDIYPDNITWKLALTNVVPHLYDFISELIKLNISYFPIKGHKVSKEIKQKVIKLREKKSSKNFIRSLKKHIDKFDARLPDSQNLKKIADRILKNAMSPPDIFSYDEIMLKKVWYGSPKQFAPCFLFLAHNHVDSKQKPLNLTEFSETYFNGYKKALQTNVSFVYNYLTQEFKEQINYTPIYYGKKIDFTEYTKEKFIEKLLEIKKFNIEQGRVDNIPLFDLILESFKMSRDQLKDFASKLSFIHPRGIPSRLIERLTKLDCFDKFSKLNAFVEEYTKFIDKLKINVQEKKSLFKLLNDFKEKRLKYYRYEKKKVEKLKRQKERYQQYGDDFYSVHTRIKRFILMLGFSPYDGYDIWENRIAVKGKYYIFAQFHHNYYSPKDRSEDDLFFLPQKIPRKYAKFKQQPTFTHSMIAGREGILKKKNIKPDIRTKLKKKLAQIEKRNEHNMSILKEAVLTLNSHLLNDLIGWSEKDIIKAKNRLNDVNFSWSKGIENYIPTAKSWHHETITKDVTEQVIEEIFKIRKFKQQ